MCSLKTLKKYEKPVKNLKKTIATLYNTIIIPHEKLNAYIITSMYFFPRNCSKCSKQTLKG